MKEWLEIATKLSEGSLTLFSLFISVMLLFVVRHLFNQNQLCHEERLKDTEKLVRAIEINTSAHQEATRAAEADTEMQRANRALLEQNTQALQQMMLALLSGKK